MYNCVHLLARNQVGYKYKAVNSFWLVTDSQNCQPVILKEISPLSKWFH